MMKALLPALVAVLCGCATFNKPQLESPPYLEVLARKGLDAGTYTRVSKGRVLGYDDVLALARAGVPGSMIVPYLKATKTPYDFSTRQINRLVSAGADDELVNYLGKAKGIFLEDSGNIPASTGGVASHPYWSDPYYMDSAPFDFGYPDVWYNSDYWRGDDQGGGHGGGHGGGGGRGGR